jgi:hypothetical protein
MQAKMQIYAEILRQIGRMPDDYKEPDMEEMEDMSEMEEPEGHHYENPEYEAAEEKGAKMVLGKKAEAVRTKGEKK